MGNPLLTRADQIVDFSALKAEHIHTATESTLSEAQTALKEIYAIPEKSHTFKNTMLAYDTLLNNVSNVYAPVYLMAYTHSDNAIREAANVCQGTFSKFFNGLNLDQELYEAVRSLGESAEARSLSGSHRKFLSDTLRDFSRNGLDLPLEVRDRIRIVQDELTDIGISFNQNIAGYDDFLIVGENEIAGLPPDYRETRRLEDGTYKIDMSYPSYVPFMKYATSEDARRGLYMKFQNRAVEKNLDVLDQMLAKRAELCQLLGYPTFAGFQIEVRMAKTVKRVLEFERNLAERVRAKADLDYEDLLEIKRQHTGNQEENAVNPWESAFYNNLLLKQKYDLNQEEVKEYFPINRVLDGLFTITEKLFGISYVESRSVGTWDPEVRYFEVYAGDDLKGRFYLDLYPRNNKYTHAACFPLFGSKALDASTGSDGLRQIPTAALICNFPHPHKDRPSCLLHADVVTLFHEFGHLLHHILSTTELSVFAGTSVVRDFVEAPSQLMENWAWHYDSLKLFAAHHKTGDPLPKLIFDRMNSARHVGSGLRVLQQIFYGLLDMTLHHERDPNGPESTTELVARLQNQITPFPHVEGTHFQASFGHLQGYAAGYYGYLWAEVYAQDMFSVFLKNGILDRHTGERFRDIVLAPGGSQDELGLVTTFLGREANENAFIQSLGLSNLD